MKASLLPQLAVRLISRPLHVSTPEQEPIKSGRFDAGSPVNACLAAVRLCFLFCHLTMPFYICKNERGLCLETELFLAASKDAALTSCVPTIISYEIIGVDNGFAFKDSSLGDLYCLKPRASRLKHRWIGNPQGYAEPKDGASV